MLFKQRFFSWFDSYDIYDEQGNTLYIVKGQLSWGHCLKIFDANANELGVVKEVLFTFLPKFEIYVDGKYIGCIAKEFSFFRPRYKIDFSGWQVEGDLFMWDFEIFDSNGANVATIAKEIFNLTDTYTIDVSDPRNALGALMFTLAVDAQKCSDKK